MDADPSFTNVRGPLFDWAAAMRNNGDSDDQIRRWLSDVGVSIEHIDLTFAGLQRADIKVGWNTRPSRLDWIPKLICVATVGACIFFGVGYDYLPRGKLGIFGGIGAGIAMYALSDAIMRLVGLTTPVTIPLPVPDAKEMREHLDGAGYAPGGLEQ